MQLEEVEPAGVPSLNGWRPSCKCNAGPPRPAVVLDPFGGSGTTLLVADRLGRDAIGCELNPAYAEMARKRIESDAAFPGMAEVETHAPAAVGLFNGMEEAV